MASSSSNNNNNKKSSLGDSLASEPSLAKLEQVAGKARQLTEQTGALKAQLAAGEFSEAKKSAHFGESLNTFDEELVVLNRRIDRCRKLGANLAAVKSINSSSKNTSPLAKPPTTPNPFGTNFKGSFR